MRLAVDNNSTRIHEPNINRLTVIANGSYEDFARKLQQEIKEECGVAFTGRIKDKRNRLKVEYRKGFQADPRFLKIWGKIKSGTHYRVAYDTGELIKAASKATKELSKLRNEERLKIKCRKDHFDKFEDIEYKYVTKVEDLL